MKNHLNSPQCNCLFRKIIFLDLTKSECFLMISRKLESSKPCEKLLLRMYGLFQMILVSCISNISPLKDQIILNEFYLHWQRPLKAQQETKIKKLVSRKAYERPLEDQIMKSSHNVKKVAPERCNLQNSLLEFGMILLFLLVSFHLKVSICHLLSLCLSKQTPQTE